MNNLLLFEHEKQDENLYFIEDKERLDHLNQVLGKKAGDEISLCLVDKSLASGEIIELSTNKAIIKIQKKTEAQHFPIKLIVAVSRPPTMKKVLEHGTSLGVSEFHIYRSELTEKSFLEAKLFKEEIFKKHLELGLSQSKVYYKIPKVVLHKGLPELGSFSNDQKYLLKMQAGTTFNDFPPNIDKPISLVLGPERGLIPSENQYFEDAGFKPIELTPSTLRVEIATFAALSQLFLFG